MWIVLALMSCHKVPFIVAEPPEPPGSALAAPPVPDPDEVVPGVASTIEANTTGTTKLKLANTAVGLAPFSPIAGLTSNTDAANSRLLRALLAGGFKSVVDLGPSGAIAASVQRPVGTDQVKLEGSMPSLMRYARLSKADYLVVVAEARVQPVTRTLEVKYNLPALKTDAYRARYTQFGTDVSTANADWSAKEQAYTEAFRAATADYEAKGGTYFDFIIKNEGQQKKDAYDDFLRRVAKYRQTNTRALESLPAPDVVVAEVKERKEVREVKMSECQLTVQVVAPPGGDLLRIVEVRAIQDSPEKAVDVAISRLVDELRSL
jgi:hypothetical protein